MPRINLLPWRQRLRAETQKQFGLAAFGAVLAAAAVTLFTSWGYSAAIDRQHERNELLKHEIAGLDKQITEILTLEAQKQRLDARMDIITRLQRSRPEVVHVFDQLARTLQSAQMVDLVQIWYSVRPGGHLLHPRAGEQAVPLHPLLTKEL